MDSAHTNPKEPANPPAEPAPVQTAPIPQPAPPAPIPAPAAQPVQPQPKQEAPAAPVQRPPVAQPVQIYQNPPEHPPQPPPAGDNGPEKRFLDNVRLHYANRQHVFDEFIRLMVSFKEGSMDLGTLVAKINVLFKDSPTLIAKFKEFIPGSQMALRNNPAPQQHPQVLRPPMQPPQAAPGQIVGIVPAPNPSHPNVQILHPHPYTITGVPNSDRPMMMQVPGQVQVGVFPDPTAAPQQKDTAKDFIEKVRKKFSAPEDGAKYQNFLNVLHRYKNHQQDLQSVTDQVRKLFDGHKDLMDGFLRFAEQSSQENAAPKRIREEGQIVDVDMPHPPRPKKKKKEDITSKKKVVLATTSDADMFTAGTMLEITVSQFQDQFMQYFRNHISQGIKQKKKAEDAVSRIIPPQFEASLRQQIAELYDMMKKGLGPDKCAEFMRCFVLLTQKQSITRVHFLYLISDILLPDSPLSDKLHNIFFAVDSMIRPSEPIHQPAPIQRPIPQEQPMKRIIEDRTEKIEEKDDTVAPLKEQKEIVLEYTKRSRSYMDVPPSVSLHTFPGRDALGREVLNNNLETVIYGTDAQRKDAPIQHQVNHQVDGPMKKMIDKEYDRNQLDAIIDQMRSVVRSLFFMMKNYDEMRHTADVSMEGESAPVLDDEKKAKLAEDSGFGKVEIGRLKELYGARVDDIVKQLLTRPDIVAPVLIRRLKDRIIDCMKRKRHEGRRWRAVHDAFFGMYDTENRSYFRRAEYRSRMMPKNIIASLKNSAPSPLMYSMTKSAVHGDIFTLLAFAENGAKKDCPPCPQMAARRTRFFNAFLLPFLDGNASEPTITPLALPTFHATPVDPKNAQSESRFFVGGSAFALFFHTYQELYTRLEFASTLCSMVQRNAFSQVVYAADWLQNFRSLLKFNEQAHNGIKAPVKVTVVSTHEDDDKMTIESPQDMFQGPGVTPGSVEDFFQKFLEFVMLARLGVITQQEYEHHCASFFGNSSASNVYAVPMLLEILSSYTNSILMNDSCADMMALWDKELRAVPAGANTFEKVNGVVDSLRSDILANEDVFVFCFHPREGTFFMQYLLPLGVSLPAVSQPINPAPPVLPPIPVPRAERRIRAEKPRSPKERPTPREAPVIQEVVKVHTEPVPPTSTEVCHPQRAGLMRELEPSAVLSDLRTFYESETATSPVVSVVQGKMVAVGKSKVCDSKDERPLDTFDCSLGLERQVNPATNRPQYIVGTEDVLFWDVAQKPRTAKLETVFPYCK